MSDAFHKLRTNPREGVSLLRDLVKCTLNGNPLLALHVLNIHLQSALVDEYISKILDEGLVVREVLGRKMVIDSTDRGIARHLLLAGIHEKDATARYGEEIRSLRKEVEDVTVIEVGANIGYYTLLEADLLGSSGQIFAIEPSPDNVSILKQNVEKNGFSESVDVTRGAISAETGTRELYLSEKSNCHTMEHGRGDTGSTISVRTWTLDDFLEEREIEPTDINVVRMDVEGHEGKILRGMEGLLSNSETLLLFIEFHKELVENREFDDLTELLTERGFRMIYACNDSIIGGAYNEIRSVEELRESLRTHDNAEVFWKKVTS